MSRAERLTASSWGLIDRQYLSRPITALAAWRRGWQPGARGKSPTGAAPDGDLLATKHQQSGSGVQGLPVSPGGITIERVNQVWCSDVTPLKARVIRIE